MITITFATHSTSLDSERQIATGWLHGALSPIGREQALELGARYRSNVDVVFSSDLARALETVAIAFDGSPVPTFIDWRLRECDYGALNGHPAAEVHTTRLAHLVTPYPGGESFQDVVARVESFLRDLTRWDGARVLVVGHSATRYALDQLLGEADLANVIADPGDWRPGWSYVLEAPP